MLATVRKRTCNLARTPTFGIVGECGQGLILLSAARQSKLPLWFPAGLRTHFRLGVDFMSVTAMSWAFNLELNDPYAKTVLLALADHYSDQNRCCWPSIKRLMLFTGQSETRVHKSVAALIDLGHVERELRTNQSSLFYLNMGGVPNRHQGVPNGDEGGAQYAPGGVPNRHPNHNQGTLIEPSLNGAGSLAPEGARPLTTREEWAKRLEGHRPDIGKRCWKPFWGPPPDQMGSGHGFPADMLADWRRKHGGKKHG